MRIEGLDEVLRSLDNLSRRAERLDGEHSVQLSDLFTSDFMRRFTDFLTLDEMFEAGDFRVQTQEDFDCIPIGRLDAFVAERTLFADWADMKTKAAAEWTSRQLGLS